MENIYKIVTGKHLTFEQKVVALAREAENRLNVLNITPNCREYLNQGIICDLFEGNAPYRPRYIVPDYEKFMKQGSSFLGIEPPKDIWEAVHALLMLYKHVPSITTMPVYLGNIDTLLNPFIDNEEIGRKAIRLFLKHIDTVITDSFCHANIGPKKTLAGEIILDIMKELQLPTPNLTLKYEENVTPDSFAIKAVLTALTTAKPSFANHQMFKEDFKGEYGIVSCYNGLKVGGGANTLVRVRLGKASKLANTPEEFLDKVLPEIAQETLQYIDERSKFIIEKSNFFETNFLVSEGLIEKEKFTGLFGIVGLAEAVNYLLKDKRFGHSSEANQLGLKIIEKLNEILQNHSSQYAGSFFNNHHLLHSQVGIDTDLEDSPGCRIPVGEEPEVFEHILQSSPFHKYFPSGVGDIFVFDETFKNNPLAILDIVKGGFKQNLRFFSLYCKDCDVVRVTGYLVKRSEIEKLEKGLAVLRDTEVLGKGAKDNGKALDRKLREYENDGKN